MTATCVCGESVRGQTFHEVEIMMSVHADQSGHKFEKK